MKYKLYRNDGLPFCVRIPMFRLGKPEIREDIAEVNEAPKILSATPAHACQPIHYIPICVTQDLGAIPEYRNDSEHIPIRITVFHVLYATTFPVFVFCTFAFTWQIWEAIPSLRRWFLQK